MKTHPLRRKNGFTLIELLVVIAIIATLAGAGFAAANGAMQKAKKTTAMATCVAIESAVNNFYTEYGSMPKDGLTADSPSTSDIDTKNDTTFLKVLLGTEGSTGTVLNTRAIKFLNVKEGKANKNGLMYNTGGTDITGLYDPWGGGFEVVLDGDYDEKIKVKPNGKNAQEKTLNGRRVAVWSNGADGVSAQGELADDVITWNK